MIMTIMISMASILRMKIKPRIYHCTSPLAILAKSFRSREEKRFESGEFSEQKVLSISSSTNLLTHLRSKACVNTNKQLEIINLRISKASAVSLALTKAMDDGVDGLIARFCGENVIAHRIRLVVQFRHVERHCQVATLMIKEEVEEEEEEVEEEQQNLS